MTSRTHPSSFNSRREIRVNAEPVNVFPTCLVELTRPEVGAAVVRVLRREGHPCRLAKGATCCGQPAWNSGYADEARKVARRTLKALAHTEGPIIVPSGSCATMMHAYWPELFRGTRQEAAARSVAARVREFSDFVDESRGDRVSAEPDDCVPVAYHDSCHMLRELGVHDQPRRLLEDAGNAAASLPGASLCCGFGGTFSVKLPDVSIAMADEKLDVIEEAELETMVGCDVSCMMHLEGRARRRGMKLAVRHLAEVLDDEGRGADHVGT
ncbi:MAG: L-lactate dehydrogenase complex protein LldE [Glaciecola sp.]|jgi:L-lactate dehydrogenase complex protein LldE